MSDPTVLATLNVISTIGRNLAPWRRFLTSVRNDKPVWGEG